MKIRQGFVSNSSSSSFVVISIGGNAIIENGDQECADNSDSVTVRIDDMIEKLIEAKEKGHINMVIEYGSGYNG